MWRLSNFFVALFSILKRPPSRGAGDEALTEQSRWLWVCLCWLLQFRVWDALRLEFYWLKIGSFAALNHREVRSIILALLDAFRDWVWLPFLFDLLLDDEGLIFFDGGLQRFFQLESGAGQLHSEEEWSGPKWFGNRHQGAYLTPGFDAQANWVLVLINRVNSVYSGRLLLEIWLKDFYPLLWRRRNHSLFGHWGSWRWLLQILWGRAHHISRRSSRRSCGRRSWGDRPWYPGCPGWRIQISDRSFFLPWTAHSPHYLSRNSIHLGRVRLILRRYLFLCFRCY